MRRVQIHVDLFTHICAFKNVLKLNPSTCFAKFVLGFKFNTLLFDNMNIKSLKEGVKLAKKYYETEASGNITLKNVKSVSKTGVDRISVGSITHSAPAMDFKLEV